MYPSASVPDLSGDRRKLRVLMHAAARQARFTAAWRAFCVAAFISGAIGLSFGLPRFMETAVDFEGSMDAAVLIYLTSLWGVFPLLVGGGGLMVNPFGEAAATADSAALKEAARIVRAYGPGDIGDIEEISWHEYADRHPEGAGVGVRIRVTFPRREQWASGALAISSTGSPRWSEETLPAGF